MASLRPRIAGLVLAVACVAPVTAAAQSADGFHSIQVVPVVVDTASFTQRFHVQNPSGQAMNFEVKYFPAEGTSQATPLTCGTFALTAGQVRTFTSLRALCAGLAAGSQFGFLYLRETESRNSPFAVYTRVSNPQGNGFSVEAFPASTFGYEGSTVSGVRRLAASGGSPAFQTNCFIGALNTVNPAGPNPQPTSVRVTHNGGVIGTQQIVPVQPGKMTRILDIFSFVGAPAGDYNDAVVEFTHDPADAAGMINFCTVQDNTSFGADFRIAKPRPLAANFDSLYSRDVKSTTSVATSVGQAVFRILATGPRHNSHVMYFRHPDDVQCEIINPATGQRALPDFGLEMRLVADNGQTVIAGGDGVTGFGKVYLGDKRERNSGFNTRYTIDVETTNTADRPGQIFYHLRCQSGSGHSLGDLVVDNLDEDVF